VAIALKFLPSTHYAMRCGIWQGLFDRCFLTARRSIQDVGHLWLFASLSGTALTCRLRAVVKARETWYNSFVCKRPRRDPLVGPQKECPVIQRRTQTATYWREQFTVSDKDIGHLYALVLDGAKPVTAPTLTLALMERHCRQEEEVIEAELSKGAVYQPKETYEIGDHLIFPAFDYALGLVVGTRVGRHPDYGEFTVIQVEFDGDEEVREFASALQGEHRLNRGEGEGDLLALQALLSPEELYEQYGSFVDAKLVRVLREHQEFVSFGGEWILRDLLVPIELGHLNIAEALIEIKSMPLPPGDFVPDLDLPEEVPEEIKILSLNCALDADPRFGNIGDLGRDMWYLQRLTPEAVVIPPQRLVIDGDDYDRQDISEELLLIEREIDDEGSGEEVLGPSRPIYKTTIALTYPHWRCGTLPLTIRTRGLFPESRNHHSPIVLIDGQSGDRMQGWVVHEGAYVYGLEEWIKRYELPVGAFVKLERTRDPRVIAVDYEPRRLKRLWGPVAALQANRLVFQLRKLPISCDYDEALNVSEDSQLSIDRLWRESHARGESVFQVMVRIMPELIKLSPQGTVHAKTIYSAVNIVKRSPPGPIFALLSREPCFVAMGGGYWTFDEALVRTGKM
jgi:hypothetical protein